MFFILLSLPRASREVLEYAGSDPACVAWLYLTNIASNYTWFDMIP